jgi:MFS family permease
LSKNLKQGHDPHIVYRQKTASSVFDPDINKFTYNAPISKRRRAWNLAYWNAALWAAGNGLTGATLVTFLASELNSQNLGLGIGLILAMPQLLGLLRLSAPVLIGRIADRKTFCMSAFLLSGLLLFCLPLIAAPGAMPSPDISVFALIILWSLHHLMQYLGTIALFSWLADVAPLRIRGRFFGLRQRWLVAGEALGAMACGLFSYWWLETHKAYPHEKWIGYAIPAALGAWFMIAAIVPLALMPRINVGLQNKSSVNWKSLARPFLDVRFLRLLLFGCWFSFSNGITQTVQFSYVNQVLQISLLAILGVQTMMRLGQMGASPALGRLSDRVGNKPVMLFCLVLTAQGPLFYFFSRPQSPWWFAGAWIVWIAYAGLNIGLNNLMLNLARQDTVSSRASADSSGKTLNNLGAIAGSSGSAVKKADADNRSCDGASNTPYIAAYFTLTGLCYAANTILGGWLFDRYGQGTFEFFGAGLDYNHWIFLIGWAARCLGILALLLVIEPMKKTNGRQ